MLSALLGSSQGTFASEVTVSDDKKIVVTREMDGGLQTIQLKTPAVLTTDLRLNEPRYAALPNIMKAKKKQLDILSIDDLGVDTEQKLTVVKVSEPPKRSAGTIVSDVTELLDRLQNEAKVI